MNHEARIRAAVLAMNKKLGQRDWPERHPLKSKADHAMEILAAVALESADATRDDHTDSVRRGYEDCAVLLDGIAAIWGAGIKPGHELVEEVLTDVAKHIRMLKVAL